MRALIFDFDGVLVNSEPVHEAAITDAMATLELAPAWREWSLFVGLGDRDAFRKALGLLGHAFDEEVYGRLREAKSVSIAARLARGDAPPFPGAPELVRAAAALPSGAGVCSGSRALEVVPVLEALGLRGGLRAVVTADDVTRTKPDPEPYLLAAERLGVDAGECVVIEDTMVGTRAAVAAGCVCVGVEHTASAEKLRGAGAHHVAPSIAILSIESLAGVWRAARRENRGTAPIARERAR